jgi:hypothetical protein
VRRTLLVLLAACANAPAPEPLPLRTLTGPDSLVYVPFHRKCLPLRPVRVDSVRTPDGVVPGPFVGLLCGYPIRPQPDQWYGTPGKVGANGGEG